MMVGHFLHTSQPTKTKMEIAKGQWEKQQSNERADSNKKQSIENNREKQQSIETTLMEVAFGDWTQHRPLQRNH